MNKALEATSTAIQAAKWATTMTRWSMAFETGGRRLGSKTVKPTRRWQLVGFPGPAGRESAGIVDLMAIRKNHSKIAVSRQRSALSSGYTKVRRRQFKRGDLFEIILIHIKGAGARRAIARHLETVVIASCADNQRILWYCDSDVLAGSPTASFPCPLRGS
jgi:hypothetical protein